MNTPSLPVRAAVFLAGALLAGLVAAGVSAALPDPYPIAVGLAVALPVIDVALYPDAVPEDADAALRLGVVSALFGVVAGSSAAFLTRTLALGESATVGLTVAATYLAVEYGGRWLAGRIPRT